MISALIDSGEAYGATLQEEYVKEGKEAGGQRDDISLPRCRGAYVRP
jgi:hypothetical protein